MPAVVQLLAGAPVPNRSKVMTQTKTNTVVLLVGGWARGCQPHPVKLGFVSKPQMTPRKRKKVGEAMPENGPSATEEEGDLWKYAAFQSLPSLINFRKYMPPLFYILLWSFIIFIAESHN
jgi:hypothetical protein